MTGPPSERRSPRAVNRSAGGRVRAVVFDLFGTVVHFLPPAAQAPPTGAVRRTAMGWLHESAMELLPGLALEDLVAALTAQSEEIVRGRPPEYLETPSAERFRRALRRIGIADDDAERIAARLSAVHMQHLADQTTLPQGHAEVLRRLVENYRLSLISNFDHGPTARGVLVRHALAGYFEPIVISDGFGRRKPHPAIFQYVLDALDLAAHQAVYVGDSLADDIAGARSAGMRNVWVNRERAPIPARMPTPEAQIETLHDLPELLKHWD